MFVVDDLALSVIGNTLAGKIHKGIFHFAGASGFSAVRHLFLPNETRISLTGRVWAPSRRTTV